MILIYYRYTHRYQMPCRSLYVPVTLIKNTKRTKKYTQRVKQLKARFPPSLPRSSSSPPPSRPLGKHATTVGKTRPQPPHAGTASQNTRGDCNYRATFPSTVNPIIRYPRPESPSRLKGRSWVEDPPRRTVNGRCLMRGNGSRGNKLL